MVNSKTVVSALALSAAVSAAPFQGTKTSKFSVNQVAVPKNKVPVHPAAHYAHALAKFGGTVPAHVASAAASAQTGSATNNPTSNDEQYITPVKVGQSTLNLDFDTGSSDLWVYTANTQGAGSGHNNYKPGASAKKLNGATWEISYGDGSSASGDVYKDTVTVGNVTATSQAVEAATTVSASFASDSASDGLLGLAFSQLNTVKPQAQKTFYDNVLDSLAKPVFAALLKHNAPGVYDFGFIDSSKYTGQIAYTKVDNSQGWWSFTADSYTIGDSKVAGAGGSISGIADTGTTLLLLDDSTVSAYYKQVNGAQNSQSQGGWVFDCSATLPDLKFTIGSYTATVPGKYLNYAQQGGQCFGGLQSAGNVGTNIFGDVFLKSQYVVFDAENLQIGFAAQA
ncbi:aspartic peptidase domain-containing protein [Talaromyces proteolyticus]|uniref:Aspartic peptidase domain-containing protein n=1 Tax=Talaromyces proteolyticus TaxID=1131652 RepID=A0AAD4PSJ4_9EURO|nr:aspartic peptidase domain-containing protein [Talaromyces proteolyticus]KAH8689101.1 aspartic peptidase domain-containing protein [Talaromyces proteolyticus]